MSTNFLLAAIIACSIILFGEKASADEPEPEPHPSITMMSKARSNLRTGGILLGLSVLCAGGAIAAWYAPFGNHDFTGIVITALLVPSSVGMAIPGIIALSIGGYQYSQAKKTLIARSFLTDVKLTPRVSSTGIGLALIGRF